MLRFVLVVALVAVVARPAIAQQQPSDVALQDLRESGPTTTPPAAGVAQPVRSASDPYEDPQKGYWSVGLFYRHFILGQYALNLFVDGGKTIDEPGGGFQFTYRKDGLSISGQVWGQGAGFNAIFRESGAGPNETEFWQSNWGVVWAAASFMWSTSFDDTLALEYGFDIGFGIVFGNGYRTEAYAPTGVGPNDYRHWQPCSYSGTAGAAVHPPPAFPPTPATMGGVPIAGFMTGPQPGFPGDTSTCGTSPLPDGSGRLGPVGDGVRGEQYGEQIRNWSNGGSVPVVVPWVGVPHLALRYRPMRQLEMRLDAGAFAGIIAFYLGGSIAYGF